MPVLTIRLHEIGGSQLVELTLGSDRATLPFNPELDPFDMEDVRWYQENYRQSWAAASESAVDRIRRAQRKVGEALHAALFAGDAVPLAAELPRVASELRVEIWDEVHDQAIPWELIADPETGEPLAVRASSFVRTVGRVTPAASVSSTVSRVLLVISRPGGVADVGYWSVAYELWRSLSAMPFVKVDILRPPTFDALRDRLLKAANEGVPYTAVHFDGHGKIQNPFGAVRHRGYLAFETAGRAGPDFLDGATLGKLLASAGVLLFSMNACRSADSASGDRHLRAGGEGTSGQPSIVEEVLTQGVPACVGMSREVYPGTPSRFFVTFYTAFLAGSSPGEAAQAARSLLRAEPLTSGIFREKSAPIDDWSIPVVGERSIIRLRARRGDDDNDQAQPLLGLIPDHLKVPPVVGFDGAILTLEDLLAEGSVVLVHGPLLSGKSRLAVEYGKWLSDTSTKHCPVTYVRLDGIGNADQLSWRIPADLREHGGLLILDQADGVDPLVGEYLTDTLAQLDGACRVIVTARSSNLPWLPAHQLVTPDLLSFARRAELGSLWARHAGVEFDVRRFHALLFFSGFPGVLLLLLGVSYELIARAEATADDIASWLSKGDWANIMRLSSEPVRVENVVDQVAADLSSRFDSDQLSVIRCVARFNVCCDAAIVARLIAAAADTNMSAEVVADVIEQLRAAGMVHDAGASRPGWFLHPLLKLVASRLPDDPGLDLDDAMIGTMAEVCASLSAAFRSETAEIIEMLLLHKQNMHDALWLALDRGQLKSIAELVEAICLFCRYEGDVELAGRVLDKALPHFIDASTGVLLPEHRESGLRVWEQAIWVGPDWPRRGDPMREGTVHLRPPDNDHYAAGIFFRAVGRLDLSSKAFLAELQTPAKSPRYSPGDIQWYLTDNKYTADPSMDPAIALQGSFLSYDARRGDDAIGRASSRILEARIAVTMILSQYENLTSHIELHSDDLAALAKVAAVLREAESEPGSGSAENRSQAGILWSTIMLARGDLTLAVSYFEESMTIMMDLQDAAIWRYYWFFALNLVRHGWVARGYETAVAAFQFAMQTSDLGVQTTIREFCQRLESTYPELAS